MRAPRLFGFLRCPVQRQIVAAVIAAAVASVGAASRTRLKMRRDQRSNVRQGNALNFPRIVRPIGFGPRFAASVSTNNRRTVARLSCRATSAPASNNRPSSCFAPYIACAVNHAGLRTGCDSFTYHSCETGRQSENDAPEKMRHATKPRRLHSSAAIAPFVAAFTRASSMTTDLSPIASINTG